MSVRTELLLNVEVGEMVMVDFGKKYGKLPCEVLDVGEGQFHVRAMVKTRKGSYRWPCRTSSFESEEIVPFRKTAVLHFWP